MKRKLLEAVSALALSVLVTPAFGETAAVNNPYSASSAWYVGFDASFNLNEIGEESEQASFKPLSAGAKVGKYVDTGVAIEVFASAGVKESDDQGIDMKILSNVGILGRFESPEKEGVKLHLLLGYGATELEMQRTATSLPDRELFHGGVFGGGVEFRLGDSQYSLNIQGLRQYSQDDLSIDTASVGLKYVF